MSFITGIWAKLIAVGAIALALGGMLWRALAGAKKAGVDQERSQALQQQAVKVTDANQARGSLAGADDATLDDSLRRPDARH